jgi:hypothetical protein
LEKQRAQRTKRGKAAGKDGNATITKKGRVP